MKPTKNQYFCRDCQRQKMRFQTEKEALRFIDFNADEIEAETGKRPIRAYYCSSCAAWHITSRLEWHDNPTHRSRIEEQQQFQKEIHQQYKTQVKEAKKRVQAEIVEVLSVCQDFFDKYTNFSPSEQKNMATQLRDFLEDFRAKKSVTGKNRKLFHLYIEQCNQIIKNSK